jgi:hypothetical protein
MVVQVQLAALLLHEMEEWSHEQRLQICGVAAAISAACVDNAGEIAIEDLVRMGGAIAEASHTVVLCHTAQGRAQ